MKEFNYLINKAIEVAAKAHENHYRKVTDIPYIVHPFEVALVLQENGASEEVIAAGILHDTLEDTELTKKDIREIFGDKILQLVLGASEELEDRENTPWNDRKLHTIEYLKKASIDVKMIACADKLSNIRSMIKGYRDMVDKLWDRFNAPYEKQKWYYYSLIDSLKDLEEFKMYKQFKEAVDYLFQ
ncbi:HD domain-containing protein [Paramaledivibacter caminithermalis]|jgi:(p)ppGpp synthase/HD superfamily hydrolase|uniref:HD domain-containing protein n=1 Tax=Paramaledivibacter caminithermalis (strain DSM 15212 / CIP 107654 / DViRD3) TaxID=1121301 RepID=A0A1M6PUH6_PARC5|nr:HD domain-containing protein [Paramaledivibacter caminithermalis]SHK11567.1 HD domain-containing protein [Paramaledivibacter caminithermalis DSM 15212]